MALMKQEQKKDRLIIFTRYPLPGKTKTRMIPGLGADGAAVLQRQMTAYMVCVARQVCAVRPMEIEVRFTGATKKRFQNWLGKDLIFQPQGCGDLGERMSRAFQDAFRDQIARVVIIGIDCPQIDCGLLQQAFQELETRRLVIGPAKDGGYYLVGMTEHQPGLFQNIHWGTDKVWKQTVARITLDPEQWRPLRQLQDIDRPEDMYLWTQQMEKLPSGGKPWLSIIVPVLNEAEKLGATLFAITKFSGVEIIVVDGKSTDASQAIAEELGAQVIVTDANRAGQMNAGAKIARGEVLLFLHADTQLPGSYLLDVLEIMSRPGVVMGAFTLAIEGEPCGLRMIEYLVALRSQWFSLPYGDQGLFITKALFDRLGGFQIIPIMEDYILVKQIQQMGNIAISDARVKTDGRRWQRLGIWKTTLINQGIILGYHLGVPLKQLQKLYRKK